MEPLDYCREIESYLCQRNDGHLIRVVGPGFEVVSAWLRDGIPFKIACEGIDRSIERSQRKGRRRPLRVEFCDADVRDVFEAWRRATGLPASPSGAAAPLERRGPSLPEHLERALLRLSNARATGSLTAEADPVIDAVSAALDEARASASGLRGERRQALLDRLDALDGQLGDVAAQHLAGTVRDGIDEEVAAELSDFKSTMPEERFARASQMATDRLIRRRLGLPTLRFH